MHVYDDSTLLFSRARPGRERGCSDPPKAIWFWCDEPRVLPDPLGHLGLNPEAEQQCLGGIPVSQHREKDELPRLGSKEGKGELKHPWLWGQCNQACQRFFISQSFTMVFSARQLSWASPATAQVFSSIPWVLSQIPRIWRALKLVTTHEEFGLSNLPGISLAEALKVLIP